MCRRLTIANYSSIDITTLKPIFATMFHTLMAARLTKVIARPGSIARTVILLIARADVDILDTRAALRTACDAWRPHVRVEGLWLPGQIDQIGGKAE